MVMGDISDVREVMLMNHTCSSNEVGVDCNEKKREHRGQKEMCR
jgi:hypothetical protein